MTSSRPLISSLFVAIASLAAASGALAQSSGMYNTGDSYIGFNSAQTDFQLGNGNGFYNSDSRSRAYSVYAGNYGRGSNMGMELGYTDFGRIDRAGGSTKADGINLSLIGRLPMDRQFNLIGKVGGLYARTDVSTGAGSGAASGSATGLDWTWGVGAEYAFTRTWSGVVQYDNNAMKFADNERSRITTVALGVRYNY